MNLRKIAIAAFSVSIAGFGIYKLAKRGNPGLSPEEELDLAYNRLYPLTEDEFFAALGKRLEDAQDEKIAKLFCFYTREALKERIDHYFNHVSPEEIDWIQKKNQNSSVPDSFLIPTSVYNYAITQGLNRCINFFVNQEKNSFLEKLPLVGRTVHVQNDEYKSRKIASLNANRIEIFGSIFDFFEARPSDEEIELHSASFKNPDIYFARKAAVTHGAREAEKQQTNNAPLPAQIGL